MIKGCTGEMMPLNHSFQNCKHFQNRLELLSRYCDANMTQNGHVYSICCRPEVAVEVICGGNVKTVEGYAVLNFAIASFSSFRVIQKSFRDGGRGGQRP